jgi:putative MATE family efflux protein
LAIKKIDATRGPLIPLIFAYTVPLILTTVVQDFFNTVDKAVLGNMADTTAVAAVGATGTITTLIINGFVGLSSGASIVLARYIGQRNAEKMRRTIDTSIASGFLFGILVALLGIFLAPLFLHLTNCPAECYDGALLYIRIYISAAPATLLYNYGSAILRTLGDTRRPLNYIMISGVANAGLNVILCFILPQKVAAVAIATAAAKIIAASLVLRRLCRFEDDSARVSLHRLQVSSEAFSQILRFGVPSSITKLIFPLANLQIVPAINSYGVEAIAGNSAAASINSMSSAVVTGFASTTDTFMGQNIGAENRDRVKRSFWYCLGLSTVIAGTLGVLLTLTGRLWIGLIVGFESVEAIAYGITRMWHVSMAMFINASLNVLLHALMAYGYPIFGSISSIVFTLAFRVLWMQVIYPLNQTFSMVMLCFTVSWTLNLIFYIIAVAVIYRRYDRGLYKKI